MDKLQATEIYTKYSAYEDGEYEYVGIRVQEEEFQLGSMDHVSKVWIDGTETEEELPGICVIDIKEVQNSSLYFGNHIAVICGDRAERGEDLGELIISDPVCVEILQ